MATMEAITERDRIKTITTHYIDGGKRSLMIAALRYYDTFVKQDGAWLFAERLLYVDWIEERILS